MSQDLVPVDHHHVLNTVTGEIVALRDASDEFLAGVVVGIDEQAATLREMRRAVGDELVRRMDANAEWTITAAGRKFTAPSSAPEVVWDVEHLARVLDELEADGVITRDAKLRALEQRVEYRPMLRGLAALEKIPAAAERLALCKRTEPRVNRSVRVSR